VTAPVVLITGDRYWSDPVTIRRALAEVAEKGLPRLVIHGDAMGADRMGGFEAEMLGIEVLRVPAEWDKYGKRAGPIRNMRMLDMNPDLVLAFHDNLLASRGTAHMIKIAQGRGVEVRVYKSCDGTPMAPWAKR